ncbi:D-alanine--D-alanine ligase family protein [Raoultibacter phocaeensis]|uniref:D-alanine--D-alanine ligase family protein n=1 Tax=Raoultibacter phocaeensis TaxID=2479841 RepID=UPI00111B5265|nr:D-alanine--D-alanine ligase family protein [Raoultibacter phocaeensis]
MKPTVGVLFGGCSHEYPVSLHSASAVLRSIDAARFDVLAIGIDREGCWHRFDGAVDAIEADTWLESGRCSPLALPFGMQAHGLLDLKRNAVVRLDAALPILHGRNGEDGSVQGALQLAGIPVVGCSVTGSAVCMDKAVSHRIALAEGVSVAESALVDTSTDPGTALRIAERVGYPLFVKPLREGSSMGLSRVRLSRELAPAIDRALSYDDCAMIEREIDGSEIGCAILETEHGLIAGVPDEIELNGAVFDYTEKYSCETASIIVPARISERDARRVKDAAKRLFTAFGCKGFARIDFFLASDGRLYFNEANTIPGFTEHSRFPSMLEAAGIPLADVLTTAIAKALAASGANSQTAFLAYA